MGVGPIKLDPGNGGVAKTPPKEQLYPLETKAPRGFPNWVEVAAQLRAKGIIVTARQLAEWNPGIKSLEEGDKYVFNMSPVPPEEPLEETTNFFADFFGADSMTLDLAVGNEKVTAGNIGWAILGTAMPFVSGGTLKKAVSMASERTFPLL